MTRSEPLSTAPTEAAPWQTKVSWIVRHPDRAAVLVEDGQDAPTLPCTELPGQIWLGDAPVLSGALAEQGLDAVLLGCHQLIDDPRARVQHLTMMATPRSGRIGAPPATRWLGRDRAPGLVPAEVWTVRRGRPPWEAPGWFATTERWLHERLAHLRRPVTGRVEQHRSWELSSIVRAPTDGGPVWLKASAGSSLFTEEGAVMALLSGWFPEQVPTPA